MTENIVLFPKMQEQLLDEIDEAMEHENYKQALEKLQQLLRFNIYSYQIHVQTLICLVKLQKWEEAKDFCEVLLMDENDEHYYDYFDYYVMILYEDKQFTDVIEMIEEEKTKRSIPVKYQEKFNEIGRLAKEMNEWKATDIVQEIQQAVVENLPQKQYYLLQKWKRLGVYVPKSFYHFLIEDKVHPVIKTIIIHLLQTEQVETKVKIQKFGKQQTIIPAKLDAIKEDPTYLEMMVQFENVEQRDPSLYQLIVEIFDQYYMVNYPFFHPKEKVSMVSLAFIQFATQLLYGQGDSSGNAYMKEIKYSHGLYQDLMVH